MSSSGLRNRLLVMLRLQRRRPDSAAAMPSQTLAPQPAPMPDEHQTTHQHIVSTPDSAHVAPILDTPGWSQNPMPEGGSTVLSVAVAYTSATIVEAEYIGSVDPGRGEGFPMAIQDSTLTVTFNAAVPKGTYPIAVRAKDSQGAWSELKQTQLDVT